MSPVDFKISVKKEVLDGIQFGKQQSSE